MTISRRQFLDLCRTSTIGFTAVQLAGIEKVLAQGTKPSVIWLSGASCTGCSVSFLNRFSGADPKTAADVLITTINLAYHPNIMALAGDSAVAQAEQLEAAGGYVLCVEGGVPTAFGGRTCWAWTKSGQDVTFQAAVTRLAGRASKVISIGTCASFGGIPACGPNPTGIRSVKAATLKTTLNIPGCPPHPDWIVWGIANALAGTAGTLDSYGRPKALYNRTVHDQCPRREREKAHTYGIDGECMRELGCHGPETRGGCPVTLWNNRQNWCVDANSQCIGCTEPKFPFTSLRRSAEHDD